MCFSIFTYLITNASVIDLFGWGLQQIQYSKETLVNSVQDRRSLMYSYCSVYLK